MPSLGPGTPTLWLAVLVLPMVWMIVGAFWLLVGLTCVLLVLPAKAISAGLLALTERWEARHP